MKDGTTQEKEGRHKRSMTTEEKEQHKRSMTTRRNYSGDVIALENVEPEKKKGTLAKIADRGGRFGKSSKSGDNTPTKNFLKKIVYKANTAVYKIF